MLPSPIAKSVTPEYRKGQAKNGTAGSCLRPSPRGLMGMEPWATMPCERRIGNHVRQHDSKLQ